MLCRFQDLDEALTLLIDILRELLYDFGRLDGVLCGLNVVGADGFYDGVIVSRARYLGFASGA